MRRIREDLFDRIKSIGAYRDAVLVLISVDYLLGYFSWAYYAAENDLGLVPALDAQYLVAGVLPTIILAISVALVVLHLSFSKWTAREPSLARYQWGTRLGFLGFAMLVVGMVAGFSLKNTADAWAVPLAAGGAYVMMLGAILQGPRGDKFFRYYGLGVLWFIVAATPLLLVLFYVESVLPRVPAALGGPAPRCIRIDLVTEEVTYRTLSQLLTKEDLASTSHPAVIRTGNLEWLFSGPEFMVVRVNGDVYSLDNDAIRALAPCVGRETGSSF